MTAREMFNKLGFDSDGDGSYLDYSKKIEEEKYFVIHFLLEVEPVEYYAYIQDFKKDIEEPAWISCRLHKAISKQLEELGWW